MINLNSYIIEKLKIDKNLKFDNITEKIEEDILTYLKQFRMYDSKWDVRIGETLKDWVKKYAVRSVKICGYDPYVTGNKKNHDIFDEVYSRTKWEANEVYKSNHTKIYSCTNTSPDSRYINIWYDEYGFEIHIDGVYILLEKKILKAI